MKKLVALLLIIAILLPAAALAADPDPIIGSWYVYYDKNATPEFESSFPGIDYAIMVFIFTKDGSILGLVADIANKTGTPSFGAAGKWEKNGSKYTYSIMMIGEGNAIIENDSLWLQLEANQNIHIKLWRLNALNPYLDYAAK